MARTPSAADAHISLFLKYASAPPSRRHSVLTDDVGYAFYKDFYLRLRDALSVDRRTTRDGAALVAAAENATIHKARRYAELATKWPMHVDRWAACTPLPVENVTYTVGGLSIRITVSFAELHPDGTVELVVARFPETPLPDDVIDMYLRLVHRAYDDVFDYHVVTFVDVDRGTVRTTADRDLSGHDFWIDTDAAGLAYVMRRAA